MTLRKLPPIGSPHREPAMTQEVAWSIKALASGKASEAEQGLFLRFLVADLCEYYLPTYRDSDRETCVAAGKHFVGYVIYKAANLTPEQITKLPKMGAGSSDGDDGAMRDM